MDMLALVQYLFMYLRGFNGMTLDELKDFYRSYPGCCSPYALLVFQYIETNTDNVVDFLMRNPPLLIE